MTTASVDNASHRHLAVLLGLRPCHRAATANRGGSGTQLTLPPVEREDRPMVIHRDRPTAHGFSWGEVGWVFIEKSAEKPDCLRRV